MLFSWYVSPICLCPKLFPSEVFQGCIPVSILCRMCGGCFGGLFGLVPRAACLRRGTVPQLCIFWISLTLSGACCKSLGSLAVRISVVCEDRGESGFKNPSRAKGKGWLDVLGVSFTPTCQAEVELLVFSLF